MRVCALHDRNHNTKQHHDSSEFQCLIIDFSYRLRPQTLQTKLNHYELHSLHCYENRCYEWLMHLGNTLWKLYSRRAYVFFLWIFKAMLSCIDFSYVSYLMYHQNIKWIKGPKSSRTEGQKDDRRLTIFAICFYKSQPMECSVEWNELKITSFCKNTSFKLRRRAPLRG